AWFSSPVLTVGRVQEIPARSQGGVLNWGPLTGGGWLSSVGCVHSAGYTVLATGAAARPERHPPEQGRNRPPALQATSATPANADRFVRVSATSQSHETPHLALPSDRRLRRSGRWPARRAGRTGDCGRDRAASGCASAPPNRRRPKPPSGAAYPSESLVPALSAWFRFDSPGDWASPAAATRDPAPTASPAVPYIPRLCPHTRPAFAAHGTPDPAPPPSP